MSINLQRYLKTGIATKATIEDVEKHWVKRWKSCGGNPTTTPAKVYQAYTEQYGLDLDQLEAEIDWLCWPVNHHNE
jgi:hypothetical protein